MAEVMIGTCDECGALGVPLEDSRCGPCAAHERGFRQGLRAGHAEAFAAAVASAAKSFGADELHPMLDEALAGGADALDCGGGWDLNADERRERDERFTAREQSNVIPFRRRGI